MSRFNTKGQQSKPTVALATSPIGTVSKKAADTRTYNGAPGWKKDAKTDLFLRASASFADGKDTFYESGEKRDEALRQLAAQVAVEDPAWFYEFVLWLRRVANIRTAALMAACDGVKARMELPRVESPEWAAGVKHWNRMIIDAAIYRADEPGELLAYWTSTYGRKIPKPVKRGVGDAVRRLYNERSLLKYDTASKGYRFGDVLNLVHPDPDPDKAWQGELFRHALDRRHNPDTAVIPEALHVLQRNKQLRESDDAALWLDAEFLNSAGVTWESALSAVAAKIDKKKIWEAVIPSMGYMALIRNLRNFDEAKVSDVVAADVAARLADPAEVAKSRQLPFRFYSAIKSVSSYRWSQALEKGLQYATANVPVLPGRTLILTDSSGSMRTAMSEKSTLSCVEAAGLFAAAVAQRNEGNVDLYEYADFPKPVDVPRGGSVLRLQQTIQSLAATCRCGYGTNIAGSIQATYKNHDRVIVFTDGQGNSGSSAKGVGRSVPPNVPVYLFNIQSYSASPTPTGTAARFDLGGLSDQTFKLIPLLEQGGGNLWPWEITSS